MSSKNKFEFNNSIYYSRVVGLFWRTTWRIIKSFAYINEERSIRFEYDCEVHRAHETETCMRHASAVNYYVLCRSVTCVWRLNLYNLLLQRPFPNIRNRIQGGFVTIHPARTRASNIKTNKPFMSVSKNKSHTYTCLNIAHCAHSLFYDFFTQRLLVHENKNVEKIMLPFAAWELQGGVELLFVFKNTEASVIL